jgi:hypothetical protein
VRDRDATPAVPVIDRGKRTRGTSRTGPTVRDGYDDARERRNRNRTTTPAVPVIDRGRRNQKITPNIEAD